MISSLHQVYIPTIRLVRLFWSPCQNQVVYQPTIVPTNEMIKKKLRPLSRVRPYDLALSYPLLRQLTNRDKRLVQSKNIPNAIILDAKFVIYCQQIERSFSTALEGKYTFILATKLMTPSSGSTITDRTQLASPWAGISSSGISNAWFLKRLCQHQGEEF